MIVREFTIILCENLPDTGEHTLRSKQETLQTVVDEMAKRMDPAKCYSVIMTHQETDVGRV